MIAISKTIRSLFLGDIGAFDILNIFARKFDQIVLKDN